MSQGIGNPRLAYTRLWHHADASGRVLGKFAGRIARVLMGKHKPVWHPSMDNGDYVVVTNVRKLVVTGNKEDQIVYRHHTMFPGGLHERKYKDLMKRKPDEILRLAVSGMLPKNKLRDRRMERLRIFEGDAVEGGLEGNLVTSWGSLTETREIVFAPQPKKIVTKPASAPQTQPENPLNDGVD
ncbi:54S ribosomal protein L23, mitochondrial [Serendipita sp. 401]|nr:54S ribosomal protein L23, mitochondrial [Serendipita sp. 401]KAG9058598.1 54S ribosomal protein L23, mitochondrial [Serendipita sp. 407]